jgi:flavin reductase (DIM6/NTAB) family NADH-FMN oxidoreductase RutF
VVARRFASGLPLADRFDGVDWTPGASGVPLVDGCLAVLECTLEREVAAGEQVIVVGRVAGARTGAGDGEPLLYHRGSLGQQGQGQHTRPQAFEAQHSEQDDVHANSPAGEQSVT